MRPYLAFAFACLLVPLALVHAGAATTDGTLTDAAALIQEVDRLWSGGDKDLIETKLRRALEIGETRLGPDDLLVADILGRLGRNEWNRGNYAAAEPFFRRALTIEEKRGLITFNKARLLGDLGATLRERGQRREAETLVRRSVAMRRELFPPDQLFLAAGLDNLGKVLTRQHRYAEAIPAVEESLTLRRARLQPGHNLVQQSERFLIALQTVINPWRIASLVGQLLLACVLGLIFLAFWKVYVERTAAASALPAPGLIGNRIVWLELIQFTVLFGSAGTAGYAAYVLADALLPLYLPEFETRHLHKFSVVAAFLGFGMFFGVDRGASNLARRAFGLAPQYDIENPEIRHAIRVGNLWVKWPSVLLIIGGFFLFAYVMLRWPGEEPKGWIVLPIVVAMFAVGIIPSWLWWSVMVPRWQVWAMKRVADVEGVLVHAIQAQLIHPPTTRMGRFFTRTEWWTPALRRQAEAIWAARKTSGPVSPREGGD